MISEEELLKKISKSQRMLSRISSRQDATAQTSLSEYCAQGFLSKDQASKAKRRDIIVKPAFEEWESSRLMTALNQVYFSKTALLTGNKFDSKEFTTAFGYGFYSTLLELFLVYAGHMRFPDRSSQPRLNMRSVLLAAIGFTVGQVERADMLLNMHLKAYKEKKFIYSNYPIFLLVLKVLADFRDKTFVLDNEDSYGELSSLAENWKSLDLDFLSELLDSACEFHISRNKRDSNNNWFEFNNEYFGYIPIELILILSLRGLSGIENPHYSHPLLKIYLQNKAISAKKSDFDELLNDIFEMLVKNGFREKEVVEFVLNC